MPDIVDVDRHDRRLPLAHNPWLERRVLHFAHQGGELEAPSNTLYAFKTAIAKGADALEMDLQITRDGEVVVSHDPDADRATSGAGMYEELALEEVKALDAAFWFASGMDATRNADAYPLRGIATGGVEPPGGYTADDFRVPTLREVLDAFPDAVLNMDLKRPGYEERVAALLDEHGRAHDVIVASFSDDTIGKFRAIAPGVSTAAALGETNALWAHDAKPAAKVAFHAIQAPWEFRGREVVNARRIARARDAGVAVHIWTVNDEAMMRRLIEHGVDGIMTSRPTLLARVLRDEAE